MFYLFLFFNVNVDFLLMTDTVFGYAASRKVVDSQAIDSFGNIVWLETNLAVGVGTGVHFQVIGEYRVPAEVLRLPQARDHVLVVIPNKTLDVSYLIILTLACPQHANLMSDAKFRHEMINSMGNYYELFFVKKKYYQQDKYEVQHYI